MAVELTNMEQAIIRTLAYFDLFAYPLTLVELSTFLQYEGEAVKSKNIIGTIQTTYFQSAFLREKISFEKGFFYLRDRDGLVNIRLERYNLADRKYKIARRALRVMRFLPSFRSAMICNTLSFNNAAEDSDIDLLLVASPGTIWTTRLALIGLSEILGVRIHLADSRDKLCLSFITVAGNYDLSQISIEGRDIYLQYWLATLAPIFGRVEYDEIFRQNKNMLFTMPYIMPRKISTRRRLHETANLKLLIAIMKLFDVWAKKIQLKKMAPYKLALAQSVGSEVVLNNEMLKFHENDRRWLYQQQYIARYREIIYQE